ncbi:MAG: hypothetical protein RLN82_12240, partial [Pseudomonadales bacterium]
KNGKQVKDALSRQAVIVNGRALEWDDNMKAPEVFARRSACFDKYFLVRLGKKNYHLFVA